MSGRDRCVLPTDTTADPRVCRYNNEFHVVDYKVFSDGEAKHGTLTVVDQMPGWIEVQDRSAWLTENGYWAVCCAAAELCDRNKR